MHSFFSAAFLLALVAAQPAPEAASTSSLATNPATTIPASDSTQSASRPILKNLQFYQLPQPEDFARTYPVKAVDAGIQGTVEMRCVVTEAGTLADCTIKSETPPGWGFGAAALRMATWFKVGPYEMDGKTPTAGGYFNTKLHWRQQ